jgi:hypothetical protein
MSRLPCRTIDTSGQGWTGGGQDGNIEEADDQRALAPWGLQGRVRRGHGLS